MLTAGIFGLLLDWLGQWSDRALLTYAVVKVFYYNCEMLFVLWAHPSTVTW